VRRYPQYKPSGVEWLGEVTAGWQVRRLKTLCRLNPSRSEVAALRDDTRVSFLPMERVGEWGELDLSGTQAIGDLREGFPYFRDGDVIVAKITPCFENGKGAVCVGLSGGVGFGSTEFFVLQPGPEAHPRWLYYLTRSEPFRVIGATMMTGSAGQQRVPSAFVSDFETPVPPLSEQAAIVAFLDGKLAEMDRVFLLLERLAGPSQARTGLLAEYRAALIADAVTGKIDCRP
jgi:restriction endonuclease S subunit